MHLTSRESQVTRLVCASWTNREIARELHLKEGTIKEYLFRLYHKLAVHTRTELAVWALQKENLCH